MRSDLPVEEPVLHGFGDVGLVEAFLAVEVGDRAREAADLVVDAGAQAQACDRLTKEMNVSIAEANGFTESMNAGWVDCGSVSLGSVLLRYFCIDPLSDVVGDPVEGQE